MDRLLSPVEQFHALPRQGNFEEKRVLILTEAARLFCAGQRAATAVSDCAVTQDPSECDSNNGAAAPAGRRLGEPALSTVYARVCTHHSPPPHHSQPQSIWPWTQDEPRQRIQLGQEPHDSI